MHTLVSEMWLSTCCTNHTVPFTLPLSTARAATRCTCASCTVPHAILRRDKNKGEGGSGGADNLYRSMDAVTLGPSARVHVGRSRQVCQDGW